MFRRILSLLVCALFFVSALGCGSSSPTGPKEDPEKIKAKVIHQPDEKGGKGLAVTEDGVPSTPKKN